MNPACKPVPELARRPRGVILIMYAVMLTLILGFAGLVLDLGLVYLRRAQLQAAADTMAITAASMLNGTAAGLEKAVSEVEKKAETLHGVGADAVTDALRFSANPHAPAAARPFALPFSMNAALMAILSAAACSWARRM